MSEPMSDARLAEIRKHWQSFGDVRELLEEVNRLRSTVDVLWATMNRDIKALADDALEDAGLPSIEGGYRND